ncbi:hypothetical protein WG66_003818 [Moniliophthora roreri]|nr:hypothetical protein WG66_003818 [Moniliophthora roreri]
MDKSQVTGHPNQSKYPSKLWSESYASISITFSTECRRVDAAILKYYIPEDFEDSKHRGKLVQP